MNSFIESMITNLVTSKVQWIATKMWVSDSVAKQVAIMAVPLIINYLTKNTTSPEAKQGLMKATQDPRNTITQDPNDIDLGDAAKMLGHIFWWDKEKVVWTLSEKTGLESNQAGDIVGMLAKYVVWGLWEEKKKDNLDDDAILWLLGNANELLNWWSEKKEQNTESDLLWSLLNGALDNNKNGDYKDDLLQQGAQLLMSKFFGSKA